MVVYNRNVVDNEPCDNTEGFGSFMNLNQSSIKELDLDATGYVFKNKSNWVLIIGVLGLVLVLSSTYLAAAYQRNYDEIESSAVALAQSVLAVMDEELIDSLSGQKSTVNQPEYQILKRQLDELVVTTPLLEDSYLVRTLESGDALQLVSSATNESSQLLENFYLSDSHRVLQNEERVSVVLPVANQNKNNYFVMEYTNTNWNRLIWDQMIMDVLAIVGVIVLSIVTLYSWVQNSKNKYFAKKLAMSEGFYRAIFDKSPVGIAITDSNGLISQSSYRWFTLNKKFEEIVGRSAKELTDTPWMSITHPDDLQDDLDKYQQLVNGEIDGYSLQKRYIRPDGSVSWVNMIISMFKQTMDQQPENICIVQDVTKNKELEKTLLETERSKSMLIKNLPGMTYRCLNDEAWTILYVSEGCYELTGYQEKSLLFNKEISFKDIISLEYRQPLRDQWKQVLEKKIAFKSEYEIITKDHQKKWVLEMAHGVYNDDGEVEALEGIIFDISYRKEMENNLRYLSEHDPWTGLLNRPYLEKILTADALQKKNMKRALISVNLSTVHPLSVNYGFQYSQKLIQKISATLSDYCNDKISLFNMFANRFAFYVLDYGDQKDLVEFCHTIIAAIETQIMPEKIGGGFGILEIDVDNSLNADQLQRRALIASEKAIKDLNREFGICFYDDALDQLMTRQQLLRSELLRIATDEQESDELFLHFQPILDLKTNRISSFEALARLETELLGSASPMEFIPLAEETKLILPLGEKIIVKALNFLNQLKVNGFEGVGVTINISVIQLFDSSFCETLMGLIQTKGIDPQLVGLEITESVFISDYSYINRILNTLRDFGINVAIDDFGTGYSSLARERELQVSCLKIDKYFIDKILTSHPSLIITSDIIAMAHRMGHCVIAEGVNHVDQKEYLMEHGCDHIQGYLVSRPLSPKAAVQFLREFDVENG